MLEKIKQNSETLIEISYAYEELLKDSKNKNKIKEIEKRIYHLVKDNVKELEEAKLAVKNAK